MAKNKLLSKSRITVKREEIDSVASAIRENKDRRALDVLMEAQHYWSQMDKFRRDRERNKRYLYGDQWGDIINVNGKSMTEEQYIMEQGNVPLKNNLIRRLVKSVIGVYRSQAKEPTCTARDRNEQTLGEVMTTVLQYNMQLNKMNELQARSIEEFLISGFVVHRKSFGWRNGKLDCWTDYVQPNNFFIDGNMRDFRGWDVSVVGELHDISFGELCAEFVKSPDDYAKLKDIYKNATDRKYIASYANEFGYSRLNNYDFLVPNEAGLCRVIEVWRKEQKERVRCHDVLNGKLFKINVEDYRREVVLVNEERLRQAREVGMSEDDVPLIEEIERFVDNYWYFYYLSPFGDILREGETPYDHESHPYVFKAYPFIDGEIHSFVADVIDQQRYTNRLITMYDWIIRASAKGVLLMPDDCLPEGVSMEDIADNWSQFNGVIVYSPSKSGQLPKQVATNSTNIGISELLNLQIKFFEDVSGVNGALQGKQGFSGQSAAHFNMQTQNATMTLLDLLESFSDFVVDGAYKDVKNIQQFYDSKRVFNISGKKNVIEYDPNKAGDIEFDLAISESTTTPAYRMLANDMLMQLWQSQAISVEQLLEHGNFPFADELLQSIKAQKEQMQQGQVPDGISPQLMQQAQQGANMQAVNQLHNTMKG